MAIRLHAFLPRAYRWYFRSSSDCQGCFLSGNLSGILILRKSWMHFSSSSSMESFSFTAFFLLELDSLEPEVRVRSRSLFRRLSDCCSSCTGPFLAGRSRVCMLGWRVTGPQMTVSCGELASDWLSQLDVDSSLQDVPLSPSLSPLPFLQQQSQWDEDQRDGSPVRWRESGVRLLRAASLLPPLPTATFTHGGLLGWKSKALGAPPSPGLELLHPPQPPGSSVQEIYFSITDNKKKISSTDFSRHLFFSLGLNNTFACRTVQPKQPLSCWHWASGAPRPLPSLLLLAPVQEGSSH